MQDLKKDKILLHQELGIGVKYIDYNAQIQYDTLTREAVKILAETENLAEEMRVLYVALTRAKEKLKIFWSAETMKSIIESFTSNDIEQVTLPIIKKNLQQ